MTASVMVTYLQISANFKSFITSREVNMPLTTPFCKASGVADMGIPIWLAPQAFKVLAAPPEARKSNPLRSARDLTGTVDMILEGPDVYMHRTFTFENGLGLYFLYKSQRVRLATR